MRCECGKPAKWIAYDEEIFHVLCEEHLNKLLIFLGETNVEFISIDDPSVLEWVIERANKAILYLAEKYGRLLKECKPKG